MPKLGDRVKDTSMSTGSGDFTLSGTAPAGFGTFDYEFGHDGNRFCYVIDGGAEWETGVGYLTTSTNMVRETIRDSSNSENLVVFSAGTKTVFCDALDEYLERASRGRNIQTSRGNFSP